MACVILISDSTGGAEAGLAGMCLGTFCTWPDMDTKEIVSAVSRDKYQSPTQDSSSGDTGFCSRIACLKNLGLVAECG